MLFCRFVCKYIYIFIYRFEKIKSVLFGFGVVSSAIQHTKKLFIYFKMLLLNKRKK